MPGPPELILILVVVLLIFGGSKIPQLALSLGQAQREFRKGSEDRGEDDDRAVSDTKNSTKPSN